MAIDKNKLQRASNQAAQDGAVAGGSPLPSAPEKPWIVGQQNLGTQLIQALHETPRNLYGHKNNNKSDAYDLNRGLEVMAGLIRMYPEMPLHVAAGVAANAGVESYFNPAVSQGQNAWAEGDVHGGGRGLFQWDGGRRDALLAQFPGESWKNLNNQLLFMAQENAGSESANWDKVMQAKNAKQASLDFAKYWERPGEPHYEQRAQLAQDLQKKAEKYIEELYKKQIAPHEQQPGDIMAAWAGQPMITQPLPLQQIQRQRVQEQVGNRPMNTEALPAFPLYFNQPTKNFIPGE